MLGVATVANIKIRYDAKTPQFAIFGTRVICVFYSIERLNLISPLRAPPSLILYVSQQYDVFDFFY